MSIKLDPKILAWVSALTLAGLTFIHSMGWINDAFYQAIMVFLPSFGIITSAHSGPDGGK